MVHWPLMGWLLHLIQRGGDWASAVSLTDFSYSEASCFVFLMILSLVKYAVELV